MFGWLGAAAIATRSFLKAILPGTWLHFAWRRMREICWKRESVELFSVTSQVDLPEFVQAGNLLHSRACLLIRLISAKAKYFCGCAPLTVRVCGFQNLVLIVPQMLPDILSF